MSVIAAKIVKMPKAYLKWLATKRSHVLYMGAAILALIVVGVASLNVAGVIDIARSQNGAVQKQDKPDSESAYNKDAKPAEVKQNTTAPKTADVPTTNSTSSQQKPAKYSVSSDPTSTSYSTTPPAPAPASFSTKITHNGQLKEGDTVYYNATKGEKGYYNGDLIVNPSVVTISKSNPIAPTVTVSSPNSKLLSTPSAPWDDVSPYFTVAFQTSAPSLAASFNIIIQPKILPAVGVYNVHITAKCGDSYQSDYFVTVNVID
jgi:cytoskeletal protein RodZ